MLGASDVMACDCIHSSKSGSSALILGMGLSAASDRAVLVIATDDPHVAPCDDLEPLAGSGAAAFVLGKGNGVASILGSYSCSREVYDIWQPVEAPYMVHDMAVSRQLFGEVTGGAAKKYMEKHGTAPQDVDHVVFSQQDGRTPLGVARSLRIPNEKLAAGLLCPSIGDLYSASALLGLAAVLDQSKEGERILVLSYGSGGADVFEVQAEEGIRLRQDACPSVQDYLADKEYIDYVNFLRHTHVI
jgi:hydroxymethylglutaryl-CoA synthase